MTYFGASQATAFSASSGAFALGGGFATRSVVGAKLGFWVPKPDRSSAAELRLILLELHFGFLFDEEVAFVRETGFKVCDSRTPSRAATVEEIDSWPVVDGKVEIRLDAAWVKRIEAFHENFVRRVIAQAAASIRDPILRQAFVREMSIVLGKNGPGRAAAFSNLINALAASEGPTDGFRKALDELDNAGNQFSPFVSLGQAFAALDDYRTKMGPGYDTAVQERLRETEGRIHTDQTFGGRRLESSDIEVLNSRLSLAYDELGDEESALQRLWIARFAGMSPQEKASYRSGDVVRSTAPGRNSVGPTTAARRRLEDHDRRWIARRTQFEGGGSTPKNADRDDAFNRDLDERGGKGWTTRKNRNLRNKQGKRAYSPKLGKFIEPAPPTRSAAGKTQVKRMGGAISLVNTTLKWVAAGRLMMELAEYTRKRKPLVADVRRHHERVMPPKPAVIQKQIQALLRMGRQTTNSQLEQERQRLLRYLSVLLQESWAAWRR